MKLIPELERVLGWDKEQMRTELGVSRATLHRWETKGLPPIMTLGNEKRLLQIVIAALDRLKKAGQNDEAQKMYRHFRSATRHREALNAWSLASLPVYTHDTVLSLLPTIKKARDLWEKRCNEYFDRHGDHGSCVSGAGFYLSYLPDGSKKPRAWQFLSAGSITPCQGSLVWEDSKDEIHDFLLKNGVHCEYDCGNMD